MESLLYEQISGSSLKSPHNQKYPSEHTTHETSYVHILEKLESNLLLIQVMLH